MWFFYLFALVPLIVGLIQFLMSKNVIWQEWIIGSLLAFLMAGIFHFCAFKGMTDDIETFSGQIVNVSHHPRWVEQYQQRHTQTTYTGSGKNRTSHTRVWYTTEHATHPEHWECYISYGTEYESKDISQSLFNEAKENFGNIIEDGGKQSTTHGGHKSSGDNSIYLVNNKTGYVYPTTTSRNFENRIKAAPTVFSFPKVPTNIIVAEYPKNSDWMHSERLIGECKINLLEFDRMNSYLGPRKFVNVIMINFGNKGSEMGQWQQAKFLNGRKNDIVLCYGQLNSNNIPTWSFVFGWTDEELCKKNLQTILLTNPINNDILPLIKDEIVKSYILKNWDAFSYISIEPPLWSYVVYLLVMALSQTGFWIYCHRNEFSRSSCI